MSRYWGWFRSSSDTWRGRFFYRQLSGIHKRSKNTFAHVWTCTRDRKTYPKPEYSGACFVVRVTSSTEFARLTYLSLRERIVLGMYLPVRSDLDTACRKEENVESELVGIPAAWKGMEKVIDKFNRIPRGETWSSIVEEVPRTLVKHLLLELCGISGEHHSQVRASVSRSVPESASVGDGVRAEPDFAAQASALARRNG